MITLKECPVCKTVKRPHRVVRASAAHATAARTAARPSPLHTRRVRSESDEALSIALDRMINEILRASRNEPEPQAASVILHDPDIIRA